MLSWSQLKFGPEIKMSFVLQYGPMSVVIAQIQLPLTWRKPDGVRDLNHGEQRESTWGSEF